MRDRLQESLETEAAQMAHILRPESVAIVGVSRKQSSIGNSLLFNLKRMGYNGPVYPVNPSIEELMGYKVYASLLDIKEKVDLVVISVPAPLVEGVMQQCAEISVGGAVIISAGFAEASKEGRAAQARIAAIAQEAGFRLVGPNCMGVLNTDPSVKLDATFAPQPPPEGHVGILSQSGALGVAILDHARKINLGVSSFVSVGNKADVSGTDLLSFWALDERTKVIALYLESFGNPRAMAHVAPHVARNKPIVAVKSGRTASGSRAAMSHSAALASRDVAVDALFRQAGVIRTDTLEQLFDVINFLSKQPIPRGKRVGVVTNAGGPAILLADALDARGMVLPQLSKKTIDSLSTFLPAEAGLANPVDMIASAGPEHYGRVIEVLGSEESIDAIMVIFVPPRMTQAEEVAKAIAEGAGRVPAHKPVLSIFLGTEKVPDTLNQGPRGPLPTYGFPENAAQALAAAEWYGRWREKPHGKVHVLKEEEIAEARSIVVSALAGVKDSVWVQPEPLNRLLELAGIRMAQTRVVGLDDVGSVAEEMGYPLVIKAISEDVLHKSDVGAVILNLKARHEVVGAAAAIQDRLDTIGAKLEGFLLQHQVDGGIEALVGVTTDATFGPLLVCGMGGVQVELLRDVAFRLPPVSDLDAVEMIGSLRSEPLLDGYRGAPKGDRKAFVDVLMRLSALVEIIPELQELDLNPVKILPPGKGAVAVDGRMRLAPIGN